METERIALSQRERDRLRVLHEVQQKQITQIEAAKRLKISDRHLRRLLIRLGEHGDRAVIHGLRGRRSNPAAQLFHDSVVRNCLSQQRLGFSHLPRILVPRLPQVNERQPLC